MVFENVLKLLADFGLFRVVIPFLLIFAIFYAILLKTGVLGRPDDPWTRNIAAIISFAAAFLVIVYTPVVEALAVLIPQASFLLVAVMLFLMLLAFLVPDWSESIKKNKWWLGLVAIALILIFLSIIGVSVGEKIPILYSISQFAMGKLAIELAPETINTLIALAIIIAIPLIVVAIIVLSGRPEAEEKFEIVKK